MALEEGGDAVLVLLRQHRAGDVDDAGRGRGELGGAVEHQILVLLPGGERVGAQAPLGVGTAAPGAGAGTGGIDEDQIDGALEKIGRAHV